MNAIEQECIILNSVWEMIDGMVNWAMFVKDDRADPTNLMFQTSQSSQLFVILLGDFLSQLRGFRGPIPLGLKAAPSNARPSDLTFLPGLDRARRVTTGAAEGTRTPDPLITNEVLYQLSYRGLRSVSQGA